MKFVLFLVLFFMIISLIIINNNEINIYEKEGFNLFLNGYVNWFKTFSLNIKSITGDIISQNWLPE
jgi:hypothetical protein